VGAILTVEFAVARPQRVGFIRVEEHMLQVFERLTSQELLTLSVGDLAGKFSCSRRHLNRLFHQYFGFSVAALRMEMRLLKAVSLLRDPNIKVINVAEQCGFNHLGLFNTCFKRRFGQTPGHWRKTSAPARGQETGTRGLAIPPIRSRIEAGPKATLNARAIHIQKAASEKGQILLRLNLESAIEASRRRPSAA